MILHPYNQEIILTKSFKRFKELKNLFRNLYVSLFSACKCKEIKLNPVFKTPKKIEKIHNKDTSTEIEVNLICHKKYDKKMSIEATQIQMKNLFRL